MIGTLEQHQKKLESMENNVLQYRPHIEELEKYNQQIQECMIFENRHTPYTMEVIRVAWEQLNTQLTRQIAEIKNQIYTLEKKGISEEQMNEFRAAFAHFDKSRSRKWCVCFSVERDFVHSLSLQHRTTGSERISCLSHRLWLQYSRRSTRWRRLSTYHGQCGSDANGFHHFRILFGFHDARMFRRGQCRSIGNGFQDVVWRSSNSKSLVEETSTDLFLLSSLLSQRRFSDENCPPSKPIGVCNEWKPMQVRIVDLMPMITKHFRRHSTANPICKKTDHFLAVFPFILSCFLWMISIFSHFYFFRSPKKKSILGKGIPDLCRTILVSRVRISSRSRLELKLTINIYPLHLRDTSI